MKTNLFLSATILLFTVGCNQQSPNISPHTNPPTFQSNTGSYEKNGTINKDVELDRQDIQKVQTTLKALGYLDRVTGTIDERTRQAVREYQRANDIPDTGYLNEHTMKEMGISYNEATGEGTDMFTE